MAWGKKKHRPQDLKSKKDRAHAETIKKTASGPQPVLRDPEPKVKRPTTKKVVPTKKDTPEPTTSKKTWLKKKRQK